MKRYNNSPFTVASWFGKGANQIKVQKVRGEAKYRLTYRGETHVLDSYDYEKMREDAYGYKNRESWFKNTYWKTDPGKARLIELANQNLATSLKMYDKVPSEMRRYAEALWTNLPDSAKDRLWETENKTLGQTFRYFEGVQYHRYMNADDETRAKIDAKGETPSMSADEDREAMQSFINKMEDYFTPEQLSSIREQANAKQLKYQ